MLLTFDANYIIIDQEIFTNPHKIILFRGRAFSQPEGLFEWDIDAFDIRCELCTHKKNYLGGRAFSQPEGLFEWDIDAFDIRCKLYNYQSRNIS